MNHPSEPEREAIYELATCARVAWQVYFVN